MKNLILAGWQSLEDKAALWLIVILIISFGLRLTILTTTTNIPEEVTRRQKMTL